MTPVLAVSKLFEGFEPIETPRLILRPVRLADAEPMFEILRDPEVIHFFGTQPMDSLEKAVKRCEYLSGSFASHSVFRLALVLKETGEFIGTGGFWRFMPEHFRAELGYELSKEHWGKGLMAEALRPIIQRGFDAGMNSIEANIHPDNQASRRVLEKVGFRQEGHTRGSFFEPYLGGFSDNAIFGLTRADWNLDG